MKKKPTPVPVAPKSSPYAPPVDQLLSAGDCRPSCKPDYAAMGFTRDDIPELIRMATDEALMWGDSESSEVWAPIHAWRVLGQLEASEAVPALLSLFKDIEDNDWVGEELPRAFALIGLPAVEPTSKYLQDRKNPMWARVNAASCLERVAGRHRAARESCISALTLVLEDFKSNDPTLNGSIIASLCHIEADEALPLIESAFKAGAVDEWIMGDWDDIRAEFGLPPKRNAAQMLDAAARNRPSEPIQRPHFNRYVSREPKAKRDL